MRGHERDTAISCLMVLALWVVPFLLGFLVGWLV